MGIVSGIVASSGGTDVSDATAEQWHIKNGKTAYIASGKVTGSGYFPAFVEFNASTAYYSKAGVTVSGNKLTVTARVKLNSRTGSALAYIFSAHGGSAATRRFVLGVGDASHAEAPDKVQVFALNNAGAAICRFVSDVAVTDGFPHSIVFAFDADAGTGVLLVDDADADDTGYGSRVAPTTGTLNTGSLTFEIGDSTLFGDNIDDAEQYDGMLGMVGYRDAYLPTLSIGTGEAPESLDTSTWAEWSGGSVTSPLGRPLFWHESGLMTENKGSAGAMTANGTIILAAASTWS